MTHAHRYPSDDPDPIDVHVGRRLREARVLRGFSHDKLAAKIGLTFQQLQKYEGGHKRITAGRHGGRDRFVTQIVADLRRLTNPDHRRAVHNLARVLPEVDTPRSRGAGRLRGAAAK